MSGPGRRTGVVTHPDSGRLAGATVMGPSTLPRTGPSKTDTSPGGRTGDRAQTVTTEGETQ